MPRLTGPEESCLVQIDAAFSQPVRCNNYPTEKVR